MKFIDLNKQYKTIKNEIDLAIQSTLDDGDFIQGNKVKELEALLGSYSQTNCTTCANGTDALYISLRALGVCEGDEIIVPSFTWVSTAGVIKLLNAKPIFAEISEKDFNIDPNNIIELISNKTKGIIPVSIFGRCANLTEINLIAKKHNLWVIEDAAQSFGAKHNGSFSCSMTDLATTSFFPAKPLGCYGDGGAIFSKDESLLEKTRIISRHGQKKRYEYVDVGMNSRLDTIQASILIEKMKIYENEIALRNDVAHKYNSRLDHLDVIKTPEIPESTNRSVWAQYTILLDNELKHKRDKIMNLLKEDGVPSALYYPAPLHLQPPFRNGQRLPITEEISKRVLSLPMHPYLEDNEIDFIAQKLKINLNKQ